jgi:deazaflavin-dependent oxidoreductase (nitroreductase family)
LVPQSADDAPRVSGNRDARTLARSDSTVFTGVMPLVGEYEPSSQQWVRDQVALYESSEGTEGTTLFDTGMPVIVVTNRGASTGKIRKTPLMRVEHGGIYALVASQGGAPAHPHWYRNLVTEPHVELRDGPATSDRVAREVEGDERALWWERAVAAYPPYAEYQERTDRVIPVLVLEPASD